MNILLIIGDNINSNSSTNIFNRRIINELSKENDITVIMDFPFDEFEGSCKKENTIGNIKFLSYLNCSIFNGIFKVKIKTLLSLIHKVGLKKNISQIQKYKKKQNGITKNISVTKKIQNKYIEIFHPIFRYKSYWIKTALKFESSEYYDIVISISHPPASHKFMYDLVKNNRIKYGKWVEIWYEAWYQCPQISKETMLVNRYEKKLLQLADFVIYSSEELLKHYKNKYKKIEGKMHYIDLPAEQRACYKSLEAISDFSIGYFGAYYSAVRNIIPLYSVMKSLEYRSIIIGPSDCKLQDNKNIFIRNKKISHSKCVEFEEKVHCLVIIGNSFSEILPGKIYSYCMMEKPIIYILDGTQNSKKYTKKKFGKYNNIYFCENNEDSIRKAIDLVINDLLKGVIYETIDEFSSHKVINKILQICGCETYA